MANGDDDELDSVPNTLLLGILHQYSPAQRLTAFESGDLESPSTVIFIGGLGDGLSAVPWLRPLSESLQAIEWSLCQVLLSSSYAGFGSGNVAQDAKEIRSCIDYLRKHGKERFVLVGHSTGCQDIIRFFLSHRSDTPSKLGIVGVVLQAPVSDREYIVETLGRAQHKQSIEVAQKLIAAGRADDPVPSIYSDLFSGGRCTITASRWLSLASPLPSLLSSPGSSEDYFSSDLSDDLLLANLGKLGDADVPAAVLFSGRDQSVPASVDKKALVARFVKALKGRPAKAAGGSDLVKKLEDLAVSGAAGPAVSLGERWSTLIDRASHSVDEPEAMGVLVSNIVGFVRELSAEVV